MLVSALLVDCINSATLNFVSFHMSNYYAGIKKHDNIRRNIQEVTSIREYNKLLIDDKVKNSRFIYIYMEVGNVQFQKLIDLPKSLTRLPATFEAKKEGALV